MPKEGDIRRYARFYRDNPGVFRDMLGIRKVMGWEVRLMRRASCGPPG